MRALIAGLCLWGGAAAAECDVSHRVQAGDTLRGLAEAYYQADGNWQAIYYANLSKIAADQVLTEGTELFIPCLAAEKTVLKQVEGLEARPTPLLQAGAGVTLLAMADNAPYSAEGWLGGGMVTELVAAALENAPKPEPYDLVWAPDRDSWRARLSTAQADFGLAGFRPDCHSAGAEGGCASYHWSDPVLDVAMVLFSRVDAPLEYETDDDLEGRILCRPKGLPITDLERPERPLLSAGGVRLVQPRLLSDCLELLMMAQVDAVSVDEFSGWLAVYRGGFEDRIGAIETPTSSESLRVAIPKQHWRATAQLYRVNAGLEKIHASGEYDSILQSQLAFFWAQLN